MNDGRNSISLKQTPWARRPPGDKRRVRLAKKKSDFPSASALSDSSISSSPSLSSSFFCQVPGDRHHLPLKRIGCHVQKKPAVAVLVDESVFSAFETAVNEHSEIQTLANESLMKAREFVFSSEFQGQLPGNEDFIRILYRLYFDREPGAEELSGWVQMLEDGASLEEIVNGFAASDEFKAIVNAMKE